ncbi:hypothetical protein [Armatimonas rosea]|uniref:Uncharacterized protein n=1 Tax=Armatimonas rosea TaxID=685828 RepID=A0A7W9W4Z0_ARMRO|nr:hypothetical protein [Armatimonas rosea]MBB6049909.1 hypothetical protein [Armatimonas rosea]
MQRVVRQKTQALRFETVLLPRGASVRSLARGIHANQVVGLGHEPVGGEWGYHWWSRSAVRGLAPGQACGVAEHGVVGYQVPRQRPCATEARFWPTQGDGAAWDIHPTTLLGSNSQSSALAIHGQRIAGAGQGEHTGQRRQALLWMEPHAERAYSLHPAVLLGDESYSHAQSLEDSWVVGHGRGAATQGSDRALLWQDAGPADVLSLHPDELLGPDAISYATGISHQQIVGYGRGTKTQRRVEALFWPHPEPEAACSLHPTELLGAQGSSWAVGVCESWIVGYGRSPYSGHEYHALLWLAARPDCALNLHAAAPPGSRSSRAYAVSPEGIVVGCIDDRAALWIPQFS